MELELLKIRGQYGFDAEIAVFNEMVSEDDATLGQYLKSLPVSA